MSFVKSWRAFVLSVLASHLLQPHSSRAVTIRDDQPDSLYLALAAQPQYATVGSFVNDWGYTGSGILIAPDWVLTAAHNLILATTATFTLNGTPYAANQLIRHPNWQNGNPFGGYDIGLAHLSTPVFGVTPAMLYAAADEFGQTGTFVGYGFTGTGLTGSAILDTRKRAFQNVIDGHFGNPSILLAGDFDNPHSAADNGFGSATPLTLEGCVTPGDSGGGVFLTVGAQTYLAGVISFAAAADGGANSDYGDASGFGRVSALTPWIISVVPEPPPSVLWATAGLAWFAVRRFRKA